MPSRVLTVMFTDIKGFTERTSKSSRIELHNILQEHEELLTPVLPDFGGRIVKTGGDSFMVVFESPTNAVLCGVMIQERLHERNENMPKGEHLEVRVAINTGEVVEREGDVFGEAVNIAARIEGITEASEIYFTESVYLAMNKAEVPSSEVGLRRLKGVPEAIKVYRVIQDRHSEQYQQLIERLRSGAFADVAVPSTGGLAKPRARSGSAAKVALLGGGGALAAVVALVAVLLLGREPARVAPAETVSAEPVRPVPQEAPDPIAEATAAVTEALEAGELGLALACADTMLTKHPTRKESHDAFRAVVGAEARALLEKSRHEDAIKLVETREQSQSYVRFPKLRKELRLRRAGELARRGSSKAAGDAYASLMRDLPEDLEVARAVIERIGPDSGRYHLRELSRWAARRIAGLTEGPLEESVALVFLNTALDRDPYHESVVEARRLLAERYPPAVELARGELRNEHNFVRMNAYCFLEEKGLLTPEEELVVHVLNILMMKGVSSYERKQLEQSLGYLDEATSRPDWEERRKALGEVRFTKVASFKGGGEVATRVSEVLVEVFMPEIKPTLLEWTEGDDYVVRGRAFHMVKAAGLEGEFDVWAYHARNLMLDDYSWQYQVLHDAAAFFRGQAGGERSDEARGLLAKAQGRILEHRKTQITLGLRIRLDCVEANLKAVEEALKAFE